MLSYQDWYAAHNLYGAQPLFSDSRYNRQSGPTFELQVPPLLQSVYWSDLLNLLNARRITSLLFPPGNVAAIFQPWVDLWINSGYRSGVDYPAERSLENIPELALAVAKYSARGIDLVPRGAGLGLSFARTSEESAVPMSLTAEDIAAEKLTVLLLSPLRFRIAKCRNETCGPYGTYFLLHKWNRIYKRGTRCPACTRKASLKSAAIGTEKKRHAAEDALHRLAAKKFRKEIVTRPDWFRSAKLKAEMLEYLNRCIRESPQLGDVQLGDVYLVDGRTGVSARWLARRKHYVAISKMARM